MTSWTLCKSVHGSQLTCDSLEDLFLRDVPRDPRVDPASLLGLFSPHRRPLLARRVVGLGDSGGGGVVVLNLLLLVVVELRRRPRVGVGARVAVVGRLLVVRLVARVALGQRQLLVTRDAVVIMYPKCLLTPNLENGYSLALDIAGFKNIMADIHCSCLWY